MDEKNNSVRKYGRKEDGGKGRVRDRRKEGSTRGRRKEGKE